jgi:hypothetical protein
MIINIDATELLDAGDNLRITGWNPDLYHSALVTINGAGEVVDLFYICDHRSALVTGQRAVCSDREFPTIEIRNQWAIAAIGNALQRELFRSSPHLFAIYGYNYGAVQASRSALAAAELVGIIKSFATKRSLPLRIYDSFDLRYFAAHKGNAKYGEILDASRARWEPDGWLAFLDGIKAAKIIKADARASLAVAQMALTELRLKAGDLQLDDLDPAERRAFVRETPSHPVHILRQPWGLFDDVEPPQTLEQYLENEKETAKN